MMRNSVFTTSMPDIYTRDLLVRHQHVTLDTDHNRSKNRG